MFRQPRLKCSALGIQQLVFTLLQFIRHLSLQQLYLLLLLFECFLNFRCFRFTLFLFGLLQIRRTFQVGWATSGVTSPGWMACARCVIFSARSKCFIILRFRHNFWKQVRILFLDANNIPLVVVSKIASLHPGRNQMSLRSWVYWCSTWFLRICYFFHFFKLTLFDSLFFSLFSRTLKLIHFLPLP